MSQTEIGTIFKVIQSDGKPMVDKDGFKKFKVLEKYENNEEGYIEVKTEGVR